MTRVPAPDDVVGTNREPLWPVAVPETDFTPTVPELLHRAVREHGSREVIVTPTTRTTYAELELSSRRLAKQLVAAGVGKGTRVGMLFPQGRDWLVTFFAAARVGAVVLPFSTFSTSHELQRTLRLGDVEHLIVPPTLFDQDVGDLMEAVVPALASSDAGRLFTPDPPMLRSVWVLGKAERRWMRPLDPTRHDPAVPGVDDVLLAAIESEITPSDWLLILFTSGATNAPKGVVHTHGSQIRHAANLAHLRRLSHRDRFFATMPFFWVGGFTLTLLPAVCAGSTLICQERFEPGAALDLIERERPNRLIAWPNVRQRLLVHPSYPDRDLRDVPFLPPPGAPPVDPQAFHNSLGMTETSGPYTFAGADEITQPLPEHLRGSFGPRVPYVQHRIADPATNATLPDSEEGEVCIRGYSLMVGLYKREREEVFDRDGWYHTGDRGHFRDGYLFFTGRSTELIKSAGFSVAPREVEVALESSPEVKLAIVCGLPDEERDEIVVAGVVPSSGSTVDPDGLRVGLRAALAAYKIPRAIVVLDEDDVAMLASGKPDRNAAKVVIARRLG